MVLQTTFENGVLLYKPGWAIKSIPRGNGLVEGYLAAWGTPQDSDLEGQWFTPQTDFRLTYFGDRPLLYHHGMDPIVGLDEIGRIKSINPDHIGLWVQAQLDLADRYGREVNDMITVKQFGWSSGSIDHLVKIAPNGEILTWPIFEGSITPTPAQPQKTTVRAMKSLLSDKTFTSLRGLYARADEEGDATKTLSTSGADHMATQKTRKFVYRTLKAEGYAPTKEEVDAIASDLEDEDAAAMADDFNDDAVATDEDDAYMGDDFDDDGMMADDDEAFMADDDEAFMADDDEAFMADDDEAFMADDDEAFMADDDEPVMARRSTRRKARATRKATRRSTARQKSYTADQMSQAQYIRAMERRIKALEMMDAPGERSRGMKSGRIEGVVDQADRKGAYKATFMRYLRRGEGWLSSSEKYVLQSRKQYFSGGVDSQGNGDTVKALKALNISDAGSVGFGVPEDFIAEVNQNVMVEAEMAANCKTRTTTSDTIMQPDLRTTDARRAFAGSVAWPGENPASQSEHDTTEITLANIQMPIHVMLTSTFATLSSLEDVAFDLQAMISEQFAEQIAVEYETLIWSGNGSGKLRGIVNDTLVTGSASAGISTVGGYIVSGNASSIKSGDPIIDMVMHLPPSYRKRAKWYMNSNTASVIMKIKDGQGRYLWGDDQGLNQGEPTTLKNRPIVYNEFASDIAAGAFPLILADLSRGYLIGKRVDFSIRRIDDSTTASQDVAFFIGRARVGGQVVQPAAFKVLKISA